MKDFAFYFQFGWNHIISTEALDHLLFITALTSLYQIRQWKQVLILITAFTIGHTLTLILSSMNITRINSHFIEFIIPLTILFTGIFNLVQKDDNKRNIKLNYLLALLFGLIHGLGFANTIQFMLSSQQTIFVPLLSFNIGIEAGQVIVVLCLLFTEIVISDIIGIKHKWWTKVLSVSSAILAIFMCVQRWPF
jgi:uncharacterized membrane protein YfcA